MDKPKKDSEPELLIEVSPMPEHVVELFPGVFVETVPMPEHVVELAPGVYAEVDPEE